MIKKQIAALRKQLDETEPNPSVLRYTLPRPMPVTPREHQRPSQGQDDQILRKGGAADFESYKRDIQSRAKAAVAYSRSFIA